MKHFRNKELIKRKRTQKSISMLQIKDKHYEFLIQCLKELSEIRSGYSCNDGDKKEYQYFTKEEILNYLNSQNREIEEENNIYNHMANFDFVYLLKEKIEKGIF